MMETNLCHTPTRLKQSPAGSKLAPRETELRLWNVAWRNRCCWGRGCGRNRRSSGCCGGWCCCSRCWWNGRCGGDASRIDGGSAVATWSSSLGNDSGFATTTIRGWCWCASWCWVASWCWCTAGCCGARASSSLLSVQLCKQSTTIAALGGSTRFLLRMQTSEKTSASTTAVGASATICHRERTKTADNKCSDRESGKTYSNHSKFLRENNKRDPHKTPRCTSCNHGSSFTVPRPTVHAVSWFAGQLSHTNDFAN